MFLESNLHKKTDFEKLKKYYTIKSPHGTPGKLTIGNIAVFIREDVYFDLSGNISIGDYCEISAGVRIFTHKHLWNHSRDLRGKIQKIERVNLNIGRDVFIGTGATIISVSSIGDGAVIGAMAVVTKNIPPYEVWAGNPAKKIGERHG
jgi:acetyltransferase-like isoleucine patch superfamily enzyme